ncbi:hypothetical protein K504DRAFT_457030 [Pleomassaria siparia CBS 279.74]|uniref:KANL3/Tex30 alpha/beta hydrolase-like domain-containing protein n=1 Tax=Pleomassaria siparia CBS 279.74 TaxID=1314801 RepID=A0A6G1KR07_9PLEO|nr:hypothetical protein K504DRAFT_457030 [Pleomassaria siparia CBS 279.74]
MPKGLDSKTSSDYTTLTITHDSVKSPIQCHSYASPSTIAPPTLVFTHGAGGTLSAPAVTDFCKGYSNSNSSSSPVLAFQGSMNLGARTKGFHACLEHLRRASSVSNNKHGNRGTTGDFVLLGGRSMGARAAVIALTEHLSFTASSTSSSASSASPPLLILASYPLQGPKDVRDQILVDLPACVSVLFVVGDRDSMCPLDMLDHVRKKMKAQSWLIVVEGADHGMHVGGGGGGGKEKEMLLGAMVGSMASEWVGGSREKREEKIWWDEDERRIGRGLV